MKQTSTGRKRYTDPGDTNSRDRHEGGVLLSSSSPSLAELALHLVWPVRCPFCGRAASVVCPACLDALTVEALSLCAVCRYAYPCGLHEGPPLLAGAFHRGRARDLLLSLKYGNGRPLGTRLGFALARVHLPPEADLIIPLPLHRGSTRSYNQALLIARGLSRTWRLPIVDGLSWTMGWPAQAGRQFRERRSLPEEAFSWQGPSLRGKRAVIVDDVCTTGTTLDRAATAVRREGAVLAAFVVWTVTERMEKTKAP